MARLQGVGAIDDEPLYDRVILPSSLAAAEYTWFSVPQGQKDPNGTVAKTYVDTNLTGNGGRLPDPEAFEVLALSIIPDFLSNAADLAKFYNNSYFEIRLSGGSVAAHRLPGKTVTTGCGPTNTDSTAGLNGIPAPQFIQALTNSVLIERGENFSAVSVIKTLQSLSGGSAAINAHCVLWGPHGKSVGKR
jgi:hypothetical protein